ncbi:MAG: alpha/beta hydrolase [Pseudomonadota bacterium]
MRRFRHGLPEGEVAGVEFGDPVKPYAALWLHATGFNAMTYQSLLAPLGLRTRIAAIDLRGHGRTTLPASPGKLSSWKTYRDDVIAWIDGQAPGGVVLGGHSMGAHVALAVAGKRPDLVKGLVLVDPVILHPRRYFWGHMFPPYLWMGRFHPMARGARRRKRTFANYEEARARYSASGLFKSWREPFLDDYIVDAVERTDNNPPDSDNQTWELLCDPKWEAATFAAQRNKPWKALGKVRRRKIPITVMKADIGSVLSEKTVEKMVRKVPAMVMKKRRGSSHFLPMEAPYEVRDALSSYLSRLVEGFTAADEGPVRRSLPMGERISSG